MSAVTKIRSDGMDESALRQAREAFERLHLVLETSAKRYADGDQRYVEPKVEREWGFWKMAWSAALAVPPAAEPPEGNWIAADDYHRNMRALDVALNGEEGAAQRPLLIDILSQVEGLARKLGRPVLAAAQAAPSEPVALTAEDVYEHIKHGDETHRKWLRDELRALWNVHATPPPPAAPAVALQSLLDLADRYAGIARADERHMHRHGRYPEVNEIGPARMALQLALTQVLTAPEQPAPQRQEDAK
jgi:hypothetical protein